MATATLSPGMQVVALALQESTMAMGHSEISGHLSKALGSDAFVHDVNGDDKSGDVVYSKGGGKIKKASYKIRAGEDGKPAAKVDEENSVKVTPRTVFEAAESLWITREDFKNKYGTNSTWKPEGVLLCRESAGLTSLPNISEGAASSYPIKLISPGRGSSGYYPPETLKKAAADNVFKAGTQMFWNHDTDAEESARPEGDLNRLAAITTSNATWHENGHDGPGLYANAKVFADYSDKVKEMGPHIGLSIRAGGDRDESARGPDGKPRVITALRNAASVDFVTKAGRDGKIFTESQRTEGEDMDKNEVQALIRESIAPLQAENKTLKEMLAATRGPVLIGKHLADIRLPDAAKTKITESLSLSIPFDAAGNVDDAKLKTMVEASAKEWAGILQGLGYNVNPAALGTRVTEAELLPIAEAMDKEYGEIHEQLADIFVGPRLLKGTGDESKRQLRKEARRAFKEGRAA